jgi:hypothetical protein
MRPLIPIQSPAHRRASECAEPALRASLKTVISDQLRESECAEPALSDNWEDTHEKGPARQHGSQAPPGPELFAL